MARAKEAAARIPSPPPPAERRVKRKSVGWRPDEEIQHFRWFYKVCGLIGRACSPLLPEMGFNAELREAHLCMC